MPIDQVAEPIPRLPSGLLFSVGIDVIYALWRAGCLGAVFVFGQLAAAFTDFLSQPVANDGFGLETKSTSQAFLAVIVRLVGYLGLRKVYLEKSRRV